MFGRLSSVRPFLFVGRAHPGGDQALEAAANVGSPCFGADVVALIVWNQSFMGEADLGLVALLCNVEHNFCVLPLNFVLSRAEEVVRYQPGDPLVGNEFWQPFPHPAPIWQRIAKRFASPSRRSSSSSSPSSAASSPPTWAVFGSCVPSIGG